jgi:serine protease Do
MKKIMIAFFQCLIMAFGNHAGAQTTPEASSEPARNMQEITIRKSGIKDLKLTLEFKNNKVFINEKPISEFKQDSITVITKSISIRGMGNGFPRMDRGGDEEEKKLEFSFNGDDFSEGLMPMMPDSSAPFLGVLTRKGDKGAEITEVVKESAAEKSGLKVGDVITKINDQLVEGPKELADIIGQMKPKTAVKIHYLREGKNKTATATLQERKVNIVRNFSFEGPEGNMRLFKLPEGMNPGDLNLDNKDFNIEINTNSRQKLGIKIQDIEEANGVKILDVERESAAEKAGLKKDDIIIEIGTAKVNNTDDAREQLRQENNKSNYTILINRNGVEMKMEINMPKKLKTADL